MDYINKIKLKIMHELFKPIENIDFIRINDLLDLLITECFKNLE